MDSKWLLLALLPLGVLAAPNEAAEAPSMELLEFLGAWETPDGEWQDPLQLAEEDALVAQENVASQAEEQNDEAE